MVKADLLDQLSQYREERAAEPQFYYNELAERGRALAELRAPLGSFLQNNLSLPDLIQQLGRHARREVSTARGRNGSHYWRFHSTGRLWLESFLKRAEASSRLNSAGTALQNLLKVPTSLDAANQKLETFLLFLTEFNSLESNNPELRTGLVPYVASYFWAVQQPQWPVYERTLRQQLIRTERLASDGGYGSFYLAFEGLAGDLGIVNNWELESFLNWWGRRNFSASRLFVVRPKVARLSTERSRAENLRILLEPPLRLQLGESLRGELADNRVIFTKPTENLRLELRPAHDQATWLAGINWEGFNRAGLQTSVGEQVLTDLQGFLNVRPDYRFYKAHFVQKDIPDLLDLADEFWLMRSIIPDNGLEGLVSEWRLLYPFACRLLAAFEEDSLFIPESDEPDSAPQRIAETKAAYTIETNEATTNNEEVRRIASLKPAPLSTDQLEALVAYVKARLIISSEKITELVTHLEAGRNVLIYGPPGSGKTRLARLIAGQMGSSDPGWVAESEATHYTLATATAEWSQYDTIGGIRPGLVGEGSTSQSLFYYFEPGVVSRAALLCEESLRLNKRPHYLIIDEFNRANQDRAFGELFTILEYRDRILLPAARLGRAADLFLPDSLRIIGTLNAEDRNTVYDISPALRRRFAVMEIGLPDADEERRFLPRAVKARMSELELDAKGEFVEPSLRQAADRLSGFVKLIRPTTGVSPRESREIGTAPLIETLLFCAVAITYYETPADALEDGIIANVLPQLEGAIAVIKRLLKHDLELSRVTEVLLQMSGV